MCSGLRSRASTDILSIPIFCFQKGNTRGILGFVIDRVPRSNPSPREVALSVFFFFPGAYFIYFFKSHLLFFLVLGLRTKTKSEVYIRTPNNNTDNEAKQQSNHTSQQSNQRDTSMPRSSKQQATQRKNAVAALLRCCGACMATHVIPSATRRACSATAGLKRGAALKSETCYSYSIHLRSH